MEGTKLFIGGLSWDTREDSLRAFFEQIGEVVEVKVIVDKFTNRSRGFGFVTMATAELAKQAMEELNGKELDGRAIKVDFAQERAPREKRY